MHAKGHAQDLDDLLFQPVLHRHAAWRTEPPEREHRGAVAEDMREDEPWQRIGMPEPLPGDKDGITARDDILEDRLERRLPLAGQVAGEDRVGR